MRRPLLILVSLLATLVVAPVGSAATKGVSINRSSSSRPRQSTSPRATRSAGRTRHALSPGRLDDRHVRLTRPRSRQDVLSSSSRSPALTGIATPSSRPASARSRLQARRPQSRSGRRCPDHVRHTHHPLRPDQQQEGRRERPTELSAYGQGSEAVLATVITGPTACSPTTYAEAPHHLSCHLEERFEPSHSDRGRSVDLLRPAERLRDPCLRGAEHGGEAGAAAAVHEPRAVGEIKRVTLDAGLACPFQAAPSRRSEPAADRDVRESGRCGVSRRIQSGDRLPRGLTELL